MISLLSFSFLLLFKVFGVDLQSTLSCLIVWNDGRRVRNPFFDVSLADFIPFMDIIIGHRH